ncbi:MAG: hypothetical protein HOO85_07190 [Methylotenera sp.]|nr:hypothetical protein [Methylotenera sp.]
MARNYTNNKKPTISSIASNSSWQKILGLGTALFITFFWIFPATLRTILSQLRISTESPIQNASNQQLASGMNSLIEHISSFFIAGIKGAGCVLALICILLAIRNYFFPRNDHT